MRKNLAVLGVVGFILVDVLLVVLALRHSRGDTSDAGAPQRPTASATVSASPTPTESKNTRDAKNRRERKDAVMLSISDDGTVVRGVRGSCDTDSKAKVEISSDTGATFEPVTPELTQVLSVEATADDDVRVVDVSRRDPQALVLAPPRELALFSATMSPAIRKISKVYLHDPVEILGTRPPDRVE